MTDYKNYGRDCINYSLWLELLAGMAIVLVIALVFWQLKFHPSNGQLDCQKCHSRDIQKQGKLAAYFKANGSKTPEEMANAVLKTKSPRLLAAVAVRETGGNPSIRNGGYKKRHQGAFQVNPKHWSKVPNDAIGQALSAEKIIIDLVEEKGDIVSALNAFGGDKTKKKYAQTILSELSNVPE
jgi:hypothetical protein